MRFSEWLATARSDPLQDLRIKVVLTDKTYPLKDRFRVAPVEMPWETLHDINDLPYQRDDQIHSLALSMHSWALEPEVVLIEDTYVTSLPYVGDADDILGSRGALGVLQLYPGLRSLEISLRYRHNGDENMLSPALLSSKSPRGRNFGICVSSRWACTMMPQSCPMSNGCRSTMRRSCASSASRTSKTCA